MEPQTPRPGAPEDIQSRIHLARPTTLVIYSSMYEWYSYEEHMPVLIVTKLHDDLAVPAFFELGSNRQVDRSVRTSGTQNVHAARC